MSDQFPFDVFLSHNAKDKPRVRRLAEQLKQAGLRVWFDDWNVGLGDIIALKVDEGLQQSRVLLLCISPNALASGWVALERSTAIHRDPANEGRRFIPLLLEDCELPDTLRRYKYVDLREEAETAFAELLAVFRPEAGESPIAVKPVPKKKEPESKKPFAQLAVLERKLEDYSDAVYSLAVSPDGNLVAAGIGKRVSVWNLRTGKRNKVSVGFLSNYIQSLTFSASGKWILATDSLTGISVRVLNANTLKKHQVLTGHSNEVWSVVALTDDNRCVSGSWDNSIRFWNILTGECLRVVNLGCSDLFRMHASDDGSRAVSGHSDGIIRFWNLDTGECLATVKGHSDIVESLQISRDGRFAVSCSKDNTVKVLDFETGTCVGTLEGHQEMVVSVAISPNGAFILSSGFTDRTVRLWDWKSGVCLQVIKYEENDIPLSVVFSPDGLRFLVGTTKGTLYVYCLTGDPLVLLAEASSRYVNAKVVLLGEGTVGKTSLAHRLIEDKYVVRDRTHGMNVWRLGLPSHPSPLAEGSEGGDLVDREALLWDLAGQEDYRLIHQLFLEETALALLLINPQKDDPFAEAGDWLKALKTAAGNHANKREAIRLLIFSQIDVGGMKLGKVKIERFCEQYGFSGWLPTSAKTGENCSDYENGAQPSKLKQLIAGSIPWDKLPWTSTPRLLAELKTAVMTMRDKSDIRLLRFAELTQRLEQMLPWEEFGESDVRTAVTLLANHGLARSLKFGDLVLLQPELLNGYAGAIIRAARAHTDEIGCVLESDIYWLSFDFTGVERLKHRPDEELLLRALVQTFLDHSLCIAAGTAPRFSVPIPSGEGHTTRSRHLCLL